jgi:hypothetical protein
MPRVCVVFKGCIGKTAGAVHFNSKGHFDGRVYKKCRDECMSAEPYMFPNEGLPENQEPQPFGLYPGQDVYVTVRPFDGPIRTLRAAWNMLRYGADAEIATVDAAQREIDEKREQEEIHAFRMRRTAQILDQLSRF